MKARLRRDGIIELETGQIIQPGDARHVEVADFLRNPFTSFADVWSEYVGSYGGHGWKNQATGDILYQTAKPGSNGTTPHPEPSPNGKAHLNGHAKPASNGPTPLTPQIIAGVHTRATALVQSQSFLEKAAKLPAKIADACKNLVVNIYKKAERKYGSTWAKIIASVAIITLPTPFTMLSVGAAVGLAHVVTAITHTRPVQMAETSMSVEQVRQAAKDMLAEVMEGIKGLRKPTEPTPDYFDELYHGPKAPGPDWMPAGQGPKGGKMWRLKPSQGKEQPAGHEKPSHQALEAFEHTGHEAHLAHEAEEVSEVFGTHFQGDIHQAIHNAHAATEGTELHELGDIDAFAIIARNNYGAVLKVAKQLVDKVPKGRSIGTAIAGLQDGANQLSEKMTQRLIDRYGHATAGAILGVGSLMASSMRHTIGLGGAGGTAIPGQAFIGAIPLVALAETGRMLGLVGHNSKVEGGLARVGSWLYGIRSAIGKPLKRAGQAVAGAGLSAAKQAGQAVGGYQRLRDRVESAANEPAKHAENLSEEQIKAIAKSFMEEYLAEFNRMLADSPLVKGIPQGGDAETHTERFDELYHGPNPPGPGWVQVSTGPQGGKIWKHAPQAAKPKETSEPTKDKAVDEPDLKANFDHWYKAVSDVKMNPQYGSPAKVVIALKKSLASKLSSQMAEMGISDDDAKNFLNYGLPETPAFSKDPIENVAAHLIYTWANTSNDHNAVSRALQRTAAEIFDIKEHFTLESQFKTASEFDCVKQTEVLLKSYKRIFTAFLKASYANTQSFLKEKGITHLAVYRGMATAFVSSDDKKDIPSLLEISPEEFHKDAIKSAKINAHEQMQLQPMSSFSTSWDTARVFCEGGQDATIIKTVVPANRIFSTCVSGVGCLDENEVVILGGVTNCMAGTFPRDEGGSPTTPKTEQDYLALFAGNKA
jgi:hypothetical protein